jgi:hypothetical protein
MPPIRNNQTEEVPYEMERTRPVFLTLVLIGSFIKTCAQFWFTLAILPGMSWLPFYLAILVLIPYVTNIYAIYQVWIWKKRGIYLYYALLLVNWLLSVYVIHNMQAMLLALIPAIIFTLSILSCYDEFE